MSLQLQVIVGVIISEVIFYIYAQETEKIEVNRQNSNLVEYKRFLEALTESLGHIAHLVVDLSRRRAHDEVADRVSGELDIDDRAHDVDLLISNHNSGSSGILNGKSSFAFMPDDTSNGARQMVACEHFHVRDEERVDIQVI